MMQMLFQIITAFVGSLGFAMIFNLSKGKLWISALGGAFCWGVYLLADGAGLSEFLSCVFAALAAGLGAEIMARKLKAPTTLFYVPMVIPLVPGRTLYYTMFSIFSKDRESAAAFAYQTAYCCLGIAVGLGLSISVAHLFRMFLRKRPKVHSRKE